MLFGSDILVGNLHCNLHYTEAVMLLILIKLQWQHLMNAPLETSVSCWFLSVLLTAAWDFDPAKMRLDVSMLQSSCQWAFKGYPCSLMLIAVHWDANAGGHWTISCLWVCILCVHSVPRAWSWPQWQEGPVPARESFGVRLVLQKCQHCWKWSRGKCVNGLVWELPLCQKQLVKMRSRESAD